MPRRTKAHDPTKTVRRKPEPVEVKRIAHEKVWKTALSIADGNMTRVEVVTPTHIVIRLP